ncbi:MAG: tripartite tricarboxylate transporter substrate binding protein, partial [Aquincola sp.]|nr:tripartite tricarboxylate transporter substrate binding protein [Aquincola sp.]
MTQPIHRRRLLAQGAALSAGLCAAPWVRAQGAWPNKPIRFIVPYNAGGATDVSARVIAEKLGQRLGQTLIIENKGGAAGILGTDMVAKAAPDGNTFV